MSLNTGNLISATQTRNKVALKKFRRFMESQQFFVFIGVVVYALAAALKVRGSFAFIMICILCVGNTVGPVMTACARLYENRAFPWNWLLFLPIMALGSVVGALFAVVLMRLLASNEPFLKLLRELGPAMIIISMVAGSVSFLMSQVQRRAKEEKTKLEQAVAHGNVVLSQQKEEMTRALEIQKSLLPKTLPQVPGAEIAGGWQPARTVGGDYYDVIQLDDYNLGICIGDVAGKGIAAALMMANLQAAFRAFATPDASPAAVCAKLNTFLCGNIASDKFITFFYAVLNVKNWTLRYENAGHCPALLLKSSGRAEVLRGEGAVLGILPDWSYADSTAQLERGDRLLLYTDGIAEAANQQGEELGEERLVRCARSKNGTAEEIHRNVMEQVTKFCSANFHDDATLLVVSITNPTPS
jgi:sigma-B regulation protein RsbU (phosphoserine phosphatase)